MAALIEQQLGVGTIQNHADYTLLELGRQIGDLIRRATLSTTKRKVLLLLDEVDSFKEEETKVLLNEFIPEMVEAIRVAKTILFRVIFSGRYRSDWQRISGKVLLNVNTLAPFDFNSVHLSVIDFHDRLNLQLDTEDLRQFAVHLMHFTGGHPGCMAEILKGQHQNLSVDSIVAKENEYFGKLVEPIIDTIKRDIPNNLLPVFEKLSAVRYFDNSLIQHFIQEGLINWTKQVEELESQLLQTYLIEDAECGFLKDGITRRLFAIQQRRLDNARFVKACIVAQNYYRAMLKLDCFGFEIAAVEILFQELQISLSQRRYDIENYLETAKSIVAHLNTFSQASRILKDFKKRLKEDWEFIFCFNYLFPNNSFDEFLKVISETPVRSDNQERS